MSRNRFLTTVFSITGIVIFTTVVTSCGSDNTTKSADVSTSTNAPTSSTSQASGDEAESSSTSTPSSQSSAPTFKNVPQIEHKFTLNAMTITMKNADDSICIQPCRGYYLGWTANFKDDKRRIIYSDSSNGYKDIIANLVAGDAGDLLVMYQATKNATPQIAARYPFRFKGPVNASYDSGVSERLEFSYNGNAIEILLKDASGAVCPQPCNGYYLGWNADFNDSDRTITYSNSSNGYKDTIGQLKVGDSGQLLLMYSSGGTPSVRGRVPFIYLG